LLFLAFFSRFKQAGFFFLSLLQQEQQEQAAGLAASAANTTAEKDTATRFAMMLAMIFHGSFPQIKV